MRIHELIDKNFPCCFYCGTEFDLNAMSLSSSSGYAAYLAGGMNIARTDRETLFCVDCKERFEIHSNQQNDGETIYTGFIFTCKGLEVYCNYEKATFDISSLEDRQGRSTAIPEFEPDFTDRDKLHTKLRTYLVFS